MKFRPSFRSRPGAAALAWLTATLLTLASPAWADALGDAQRLLAQHRLPEALAQADAAVAANGREPRARFLRGLILTEMGRRDEAIGVFQQLTLDFPELAEPYNNLAVLQAQQGRFEQARAALELAVRLQPKNAMAYRNLGDVHLQLARQAYEQASHIDPRAAGVEAKLKALQDLAPNAAPRP